MSKRDRVFRFKGFRERISEIKIDVVHRISKEGDIPDDEEDTFFRENLEKWRELNCTEYFDAFYREIKTKVGSLKQLIFNKDEIVGILLRHLQVNGSLALDAVIDLVAQLARDLQYDFLPYFQRFFKVFLAFVNCSDPTLIENTFVALAFQFKYLWRNLIKDIDSIYELYKDLLTASSKPHIIQFAAESFSFLIRRVKDHKSLLRMILEDLTLELVEGIGKLFFETIKGVQKHLHSCAEEIFDTIVSEMLSAEGDEKADLVFEVLKTMINLALKDLDETSVHTLWSSLLRCLYTVASEYECRNICGNGKVNASLCHLLNLLKVIVKYKGGEYIPDDKICQVLHQFGKYKMERMLTECIMEITIWLIQGQYSSLENDNKRTLMLNILCSHIEFPILKKFVQEIVLLEIFPTVFLSDFLNIIHEKMNLSNDSEIYQEMISLLVVFVDQELSNINAPYNYKINLGITFHGDDICSKVCNFGIQCLDNVNNSWQTLDSLLKCVTFIRPLDYSLVINLLKKCFDTCKELLGEQVTTDSSRALVLISQCTKSWISLSLEQPDILNDLVDHVFFLNLLRNHTSNRDFLDAFECYCLHVRLSSLRPLPLDEILPFYHQLKENLASPHMDRCVLTLKILKLYVDSHCSTEDKEDLWCCNILKTCIDAAHIPATFEGYQGRLVFLRNLQYRKHEDNDQFQWCHETALLFLISNLYINLSLLWDPVIDIISSYFTAENAILFWPTWSKVLTSAFKKCGSSQDSEMEIGGPWASTFIKYNGVENRRADIFNFRLLLIKSMSSFPEIVERKSRDVVPLFLDFVNTEFYKSDTAAAPRQSIKRTRATEMEGGGAVNETDEAEVDQIEQEIAKAGPVATSFSLSSKKIRTLTEVLRLLAQFKNPRAMYKESELFKVYQDFLGHRNNEVQKWSLACIFTFKLPFVKPYEEHLNHLFDDKTFRDELTLLITEETDSIIDHSHRGQLIPFLIRILIGKLYRRSGLGASGKSSHVARRNIIMQFLSLCTVKEMETFFDIICEPFKTRLQDKSGNAVDVESVIPLKKQQSFLNMLTNLFSRLKMGISSFLPRIMKILLLILTDANTCLGRREEIASCYIAPLKDIRQLGIQNLITVYDSYVKCHLEEYTDDVFKAAVSPQLGNFSNENHNHPTVLMKLFVTWSKHGKYHHLLAYNGESSPSCPLVAILNLLSVPLLSDEVATCVLTFINAVLDVKEPFDVKISKEGDGENVQENGFMAPYGTMLVKPHTKTILKFLSSVINNLSVKARWKSSKAKAATAQGLHLHLSVLSKISEFVQDSAECETIARLLLPFARFSKTELATRDTLISIKNLIVYVPNVDFAVDDISSLFGAISPRGARTLLCELFEVISRKADGMELISPIVQHINAWDAKRLDEADYDRRLKGHRGLCALVRDSSLTARQLLPLICNCTFTIVDTEDLSLRDAASNSLAVIITVMSHLQDAEMVRLANTAIIPAVKNGLKSKKEATRNCFIQILSQLVTSFPGLSVSDLKVLTNADVEVDFFQNVRHIQIHRRIRAIHQFTQLCNKGTSLSVPSLYEYMLPLMSHFLFDKSTAKDHNVVGEAVAALGTIASMLPWQKYCHVLRSYLKLLTRTEENQKILSRMMCTWLDAFHFEMTTIEEEGSAHSAAASTDIEMAADEKNGSSDEDEEADMDAPVLASNDAGSTKDRAKRILETILDRILPPLQKFLTKKLDTEDKLKQLQVNMVDQQEILRIPLALTVTKLLQKLPKSVLNLQLQGVLLKVCNSLKSRARDVRDVARDTLVKMTLSLGHDYLPMILKEMHGVLRRGYQRHVLSFTVHKILEALSSTMKPGDLDPSIKRLSEIANEDIFGESAEEKEVQKIVDKLFEAKTVKSYDTIEIVGRFVSTNHIMNIVDPIKTLLENSQSHKVAHKAEEALRKYGVGLQGNSGLSDPNLLIFVYNVAKQNMTLEGAKEGGKTTNAKTQHAGGVESATDIFVIPSNPGRSGVVPATSKTSSVHVLVEFALQLLVTSLKHQRFSKSNEENLRMLDPFIELCANGLESRHIKIVVLSMRSLSHLVKFPLPSVGAKISRLTKQMFKILKNYSRTGTGKGDNFELVMTAFKAMTVLIRDYRKQQITTKQLKVLLTFVEEDIYDHSKQTTAFPMLKAILARKLDSEAVHEVMEKVQKLVLTSESPSARQSCRQLTLQYLLDYPLGKKVEKILQFFLSNLSFDEQFGRESDLELCALLFNNFPQQLLHTYSGLFFVPLSMRLVNEESPSCKRLAYHTIRLLLQKLDTERKDHLFSMVLKWKESDKPVMQKLMCQLIGLFADAEERSFERRLGTSLPVMSELISSPEFEEDEDDDGLETDDISSKDHLLFTALGCLNRVCRHCSFVRSANFAEVTSDILESVQRHLLHSHAWVRLSSSQIIGHFLSSWSVDELVAHSADSNSAQGYLVKNLHEKVWELSIVLCDQLKTDGITEDLATQSAKNLVFLGKIINKVESAEEVTNAIPEEDNGKGKEKKRLSVSWLAKKICGLATYESAYAPKEYVKRKAVFQWIAAVALDLGKAKLSQAMLILLLRPIRRELNNALLPAESELKMLAQEVLDLFRNLVGVENFAEAYSQLQHKISDQKEARKRKLAAEAVTNPEKAARRKLKHNLAKREHKKRKLIEKKPMLKVKKMRSGKEE